MNGTVAVLGERALVQGFALAGARVFAAESPAGVREAWAALPADVLVLVLTPAAATALAARPEPPGGPMRVVIPA